MPNLSLEYIQTKQLKVPERIQTVLDDFYTLRLMHEDKVELAIKSNIVDAKATTLEVFQSQFIPAYSIEKAAFDSLRKRLFSLTDRRGKQLNWLPRKTHLRKSFYDFEYMQIPAEIRRRMQKETGSIPEGLIDAVSEINKDPFAESLFEGVAEAASLGGQTAFGIFDIGAVFNLRDLNVEQYLREYEIQLSKAVTEQFSSAIKFELLEGVRAGESIQQLADRIQRVWDKPITVSVPPKIGPDGAIVRAGYSYQLGIETWATTVARTETARGYIEGKLNGYRQTGVVPELIFVTTPDERLCPQCAFLEGKKYKLEDAVGIIPVHGSCRCTFIPSVELTPEILALAEANVEGLE